MSKLKRTSYMFTSCGALLLSFYVFYAQPSWMFNLYSNQADLYGHLTGFSLTEHNMENQFGEVVTWKDYSDKPLYVTAGFTSCASSCPITMSHYQKLSNKLDKKVYFSFLTIDPKRDTATKLANYLQGINDDFVGIRISNSDVLDKVVDEFKQSVFVPTNNNQIAHKYYIYLIHPKLKGFIVYDAINPDIDLMEKDFNILFNEKNRSGS